MDSVKGYKCRNCGGGLEFDPASQKWKCDYCFSEFGKQEIETEAPVEETLEKTMPDLDSYHCTSCGAELIADTTTSATSVYIAEIIVLLNPDFQGNLSQRVLFLLKSQRLKLKKSTKTGSTSVYLHLRSLSTKRRN